MIELSKIEKDAIKKEIEAEFPHDPALQQVHIARKIISRKAELEGISLFKFIKKHRKSP
ncbi:MAG: hypothetical protein ACTSRK_15065 [Promethearchaeota archaeon]